MAPWRTQLEGLTPTHFPNNSYTFTKKITLISPSLSYLLSQPDIMKLTTVALILSAFAPSAQSQY